ncbi:MAG: phosphatidate cytidylyltransferase [Muribaculaceae bacterium]|nr:phosphatidate cytidylyltransferase [Muribaculaceae bacterium]
MGLDKKNLIVRAASGCIYVALIVGAILLGFPATAILMLVFAIVAYFEFTTKIQKFYRFYPINHWLTAMDLLMILMMILGPCVTSSDQIGIICTSGAIFFLLRLISEIFIAGKNPMLSIGISLTSLFYIGVPLASLVVATRLMGAIPWFVVCTLAMIWINDTGAYIVGCTIGRHKLSPKISPNKSWEGFLGGLLFNVGAAFIYFYCFNLRYFVVDQVWPWILIGVGVTVFATVGDLFESMIKRSIGVKDFGTAIPGHGGVLDRIDSLLFVVPTVLINSIILISPEFLLDI